MVPLERDSPLTVPEFDASYCVGCGGCLSVCPAKPKAFAVHGVSPQTLTPGIRRTEEENAPFLPALEGDFPF
jgi:ferredoxin